MKNRCGIGELVNEPNKMNERNEMNKRFQEYLVMRNEGTNPLEKMLVLAISELERVTKEYKHDVSWCQELIDNVERSQPPRMVDMMTSMLGLDYAPTSPSYEPTSPRYGSKTAKKIAEELTRKRKRTESDCERDVAKMRAMKWVNLVNDLGNRVWVMNEEFDADMIDLIIQPSRPHRI